MVCSLRKALSIDLTIRWTFFQFCFWDLNVRILGEMSLSHNLFRAFRSYICTHFGNHGAFSRQHWVVKITGSCTFAVLCMGSGLSICSPCNIKARSRKLCTVILTTTEVCTVFIYLWVLHDDDLPSTSHLCQLLVTPFNPKVTHTDSSIKADGSEADWIWKLPCLCKLSAKQVETLSDLCIGVMRPAIGA